MERYRCKNPKCRQPVLFEGEFTGIVKKICPKCGMMNEFIEEKIGKLEKYCNDDKK